MMSPIQFALSEIRERIPEELLVMTFAPKYRYRSRDNRYHEASLEMEIRNRVIESRIRKYIDSYGSQQVDIPLDGLDFQYHDQQAWSVHIPKSRTKGRSITQAISVHIGYQSQLGYMGLVGVGGSGVTINTSTGCGSNSSIQAARNILNANKPTDVTYTSNVYLVEENTIYCEDRISTMNLVLKCMLAADSEFSFIHGGYIQAFADLCVLATEAYISRNKRVVLDKAALEGGMELGVIREYVDKYADSDEAFREMIRTRWRKIQRLTDKPRSMEYLDMMITPGG